MIKKGFTPEQAEVLRDLNERVRDKYRGNPGAAYGYLEAMVELITDRKDGG